MGSQVEICCTFDLCVLFSLSVTWCAAARFFRLNIHQFKVHNSRTKEQKSYFQDLFRVYLLLPAVLHIYIFYFIIFSLVAFVFFVRCHSSVRHPQIRIELNVKRARINYATPTDREAFAAHAIVPTKFL